MSAALVSVPFDGDALDAARADGTIWIAVARTCDALGIDTEGQRQRLVRSPWAWTCVMQVQLAGDAQGRRVFAVDLDSLPMWLATIDASRVSPDAAPKLIRYQREAARVLREHFFGPARPAPLPAVDARAEMASLLGRLAAAGQTVEARVVLGAIDLLGKVAAGQLSLFPEEAPAKPRRPVDLSRYRQRVLSAAPARGGIEGLAEAVPGKRIHVRAAIREMLAEGTLVRTYDEQGRVTICRVPAASEVN